MMPRFENVVPYPNSKCPPSGHLGIQGLKPQAKQFLLRDWKTIILLSFALYGERKLTLLKHVCFTCMHHQHTIKQLCTCTSKSALLYITSSVHYKSQIFEFLISSFVLNCTRNHIYFLPSNIYYKTWRFIICPQ